MGRGGGSTPAPLTPCMRRYIRTLEQRQGLKVGCLKKWWRQGWINEEQLERLSASAQERLQPLTADVEEGGVIFAPEKPG